MDAAAAAAAAAAASSPNPSGFSPGVGGEREKAAIAAHPLYERLLEAHVACLRVATPVDQLPRIDAQIAARPPPLAAAAGAAAAGGPSGGEELDLFMVRLDPLRAPSRLLGSCALQLNSYGLADLRCGEFEILGLKEGLVDWITCTRNLSISAPLWL
jgi:hypothetical protein